MPYARLFCANLAALLIALFLADSVTANEQNISQHYCAPACISENVRTKDIASYIEHCIATKDLTNPTSIAAFRPIACDAHINNYSFIDAIDFEQVSNLFLSRSNTESNFGNRLTSEYHHLLGSSFSLAKASPSPLPSLSPSPPPKSSLSPSAPSTRSASNPPSAPSSSPSLETTIKIEWDDATLRLSSDGSAVSLISNHDDRNHISKPYRFVRLETTSGPSLPTQITKDGDHVAFRFSNGHRAKFKVTTGLGHSRWELVDYEGDQSNITGMRLGALNLAGTPKAEGQYLNIRYLNNFVVGVMSTQLNISASALPISRANLDGVTHSFTPQSAQVKQGSFAAAFQAQSTRSDGKGYAVVHKSFDRVKDLSGLNKIKAWVHGDNSCPNPSVSEMCTILKVQLKDRYGRYLDMSRKLNFSGWEHIELNVKPNISIESFDLSQVVQMSFYYNNIRAKSAANILLDSISAVTGPESNVLNVMLEDFEDQEAALWDGLVLAAQSVEKFNILPAGFVVLATKESKLDAVLQSIETESELPHIVIDGKWGKHSKRVKNNYLFVHKFSLDDVDSIITWAKRGGFDTILVSSNWSKSYGHHQVDTTYFPRINGSSDGLPSLVLAADKIHAAGLNFGLHVLGAAVAIDDPFITTTPTSGPDSRIYRGASTQLGAKIGPQDDFIPTSTPPLEFPSKDGGYNGMGTFLLIDNEVIKYESLQLTPPYGFNLGTLKQGEKISASKRGQLGTTSGAHKKGAVIDHLVRSYGYFLYDIDTDLAQQISSNFCRVANATKADMIYLDGIERLQGGSKEHWYYNARLIDIYHQCLTNKNTLMQASSYSHYSWHYLSRHASGDLIEPQGLKNYIDEVVAKRYAGFINDRMPIDSGWYFAVSPNITVDQTEYLLNYVAGYDSSVSVSTYGNGPRVHPELEQVFDLVSRYDRLRRDKPLGETTRAALRQPQREYRLTTQPEAFTRVKYSNWQSIDIKEQQPVTVALEAIDGQQCRPGMEFRLAGTLKPGPSYRDNPLVTLDDFSSDNGLQEFQLSHSENVEVSAFKRIGSCPEKGSCLLFSAKNNSSGIERNHAVALRKIETPVDVGALQGIGMWLFGDGRGGNFKLQLRAGPWTSSVPYSDYFVDNNFTGWRYFQLEKPIRSRGNLPQVMYLAMYIVDIPSNQEVVFYVDDIRALQSIDLPMLRNPSMTLNEQKISILGDLQPGERMIYFPTEGAKIITSRPGKPVKVNTSGTIGPLSAPTTAQVTAQHAQMPIEFRSVLSCSESLSLSK